MTEYPNGEIPASLCLVIEYWVLVINWSLVIGVWLFIFCGDYAIETRLIGKQINVQIRFPEQRAHACLIGQTVVPDRMT